MPDNVILERMLDRLYASLVRGPSLNCRPHNSRQRIDLTLLGGLDDGRGSSVLTGLFGEDRRSALEAKVPMPAGYRPGRWGDKPVKVDISESEVESSAAGQAGEVPELDPEALDREKAERAAVRRYTQQRSLLSKLRNLSDDAKTYEQDTGVGVLSVGVGLLSLPPGTVGGGSKRILAPIAMLPVDLAVRSGARSGVALACREEGVERVQPNLALLAWLERETQQRLPDDLFADEAGEQPLVELQALIETVAGMLKLELPGGERTGAGEGSAGPPAEAGSAGASDAAEDAQPAPPIVPLFGEGFAKLAPVPRSDELPDGPAVLPCAVLGLFPVSNQGLLRDTRELIDRPAADGPIRPFIDSEASLASAEHDLAEAEPTEHRATRRFADERFVARADPCQAQTVRLAHRETGLVIHGPPGTGKSQTITNIIGDFLGRGQRVLFVCDKRTALDVVYNRLEHLGLDRLCALIHDPQRDQKDLYMAVRARLEELTDLKTAPRAQSTVDKIDKELQSIHDELMGVYDALMSSQGEGMAFHEQIGRWMTIDAPHVDGLEDVLGEGLSPEAVQASRADIEVVLGRAEAVGLPSNPWLESAGLSLEDYLSRSPDEMRRQLAGVVEDVRVMDATAHEDIPPFETGQTLEKQASQRAELLSALREIDGVVDPAVRIRVEGWDASVVAKRARELAEAEPMLKVVKEGALDRELWMLVRDALPSMRELAQQVGELDAYLESCNALLGFLRFAHRKQGKAVLRSYGLSADPEQAKQLKAFLIALRARLVLSEILSVLRSDEDEAAGLLEDDVLDAGFASFRTVLSSTATADTIEPVKEAWRRALRSDDARARLLEGLGRSAARAEAIERAEATFSGVTLFVEAWQTKISAAVRGGKQLSQLAERLEERFDDLENVLRVREGLDAMPVAMGQATRAIALAGVGPQQGVLAIERAVLGKALRKQVAEDETLRGLDPQRLDRNMARYLELEDDKRGYVVKSILHQWTEKQRQRLLVGTGSRLNGDGAALRNRLFVRGKRAMRLRQVISVGQDIEGGDPLFDMCPVWLASPETVAQVFPLKEMFDVVIFDEASQCRLEEALPVLVRGERVVIAGDPKQLPPTRFFESSVATSEDEPIENERDVFEAQLTEVEDLLAAALNLEVQESYLDVHYRSQNADLIGFSNQQFYHDRLQPIPGHPRNTVDTPPIQLHRVNGTYDDRVNPDEARYVVHLIAELLEEDDPPSIGVATFNLVQRDLIAELLDEMAAQDDKFARRLAAARNRTSGASFEGLFVKNLENVQGDERDHIIISTTYGPTPEGRFYKRFGPLRQAGGGRRLNVLVTRARTKVHLCTSIPREVYAAAEPLPDGANPNGAWLLFAYLRYAEQLEHLYEAERKQPIVSPAAPDVAEEDEPTAFVRINRIEPHTDFAIGLAGELANEHRVTSEAHWGNEGFCIDAALLDPRGPGGVTLGLLTDFNRYRYATDPIAWEVYRTAILQGQGWDIQRVWSPTYLRDKTRVFNELTSGHKRVIASQTGHEGP